MSFVFKINRCFLIFSLLTAMSFSAYSDSSNRDGDVQNNYKRYKSLAAPKQKQLLNKWQKFKKESDWDSKSPADRRQIKERVMREGR